MLSKAAPITPRPVSEDFNTNPEKCWGLIPTLPGIQSERRAALPLLEQEEAQH